MQLEFFCSPPTLEDFFPQPLFPFKKPLNWATNECTRTWTADATDGGAAARGVSAST